MKRAFTLIELLVVIAIIAILAAILFPVFAQAKASAKATATLSNVKQTSLSVIMYGADSDDTFPIATQWNSGSDQLSYGAGFAFSTWAWRVVPYTKNTDLFMDALAPTNVRRAAAQQNFDAYHVQMGYNHTYLSPDFGASPGSQSTTSQTSFANPAETVMLAAKYANTENKSGSDWGTGFPGGVLSYAVVEAPDCYFIPQWCLSGWGGGASSFHEGILKLTPVQGGRTGGVSFRHANQTTVAWVDGHAKRTTAGALAAGTNWNATAPEGVRITDLTRYVWDNQ
ncbi:MAG: prepilin-type N-terminal cleavage/methylation domain-containing protein [Fimbriimonas sp.]|jgi:prepilin-type N-terminal cleavage/methylation domain-containing protein/prepilin-type processing-associated H-X9-DG protein|nr:prepilin-type N-terminal cleavage/methylation domain-containing protein [Fimbriimonas sp.]